MKFTKIVLCLLAFALVTTSLFALDAQSSYEVSFTYTALGKKGTGSSGEGVKPEVIIKMTDNTHADITIPRFSFSESKTIEKFVINAVNVTTDKNGTPVFELKSFETTDGKTKVKGSDLKGTVKDGKLELYVEFKVSGMPFKLKVTYTSK